MSIARSRLALLVLLGSALALLAACSETQAPEESAEALVDEAPLPLGPAAEADYARWLERREEGLRRPEGYLALVGLAWLEPGENLAGGDPRAAVPLPADAVPAEIGRFVLEDERVRFVAGEALELFALGEDTRPLTPGESLVVAQEGEGSLAALRAGRLTMRVIARGERYAVRTWDPEAPTLREFAGVERFPPNARYVLPARFEPFEAPREIAIETVIDVPTKALSHGRVVFELGGEERSLLAFGEPQEGLWTIFGDATSGEETYGGGRFLTMAAPEAGRLELDFNRAYNPPCAFVAWSTCPLPPAENRLEVAVRAGERAP